jgi:hypothetical protein
MIQKVVFPSFRENEYSQYDMRQLVSALELRFQSLESNVEGFFPTSADADFDDRYAAAVHTHLVADIIDFDANVPSSIFDLDDVTGTASVGQGLIWNGAEFVAGPLGGSTNLNDLLDVNAPSPSDGEALVWDVSTLRWVPGTASGGGGDSLFGLTDTDLAGQLQGDLLFNANGTEWQSTGWKFQWVDDQYLQFGNGIGINWYDSNFNTAEFLVLEGENGPGPLLTDFALRPKSGTALNIINTISTVFVNVTDVTEGTFELDTSSLTDGANYWLFFNTTVGNGSSATAFSETILSDDGGTTSFPGSLGSYGTANSYGGVDYNYQTVRPIDVAANINLMSREVAGADAAGAENASFRAFGINIDNLPAGSFYHFEDTSRTVLTTSFSNLPSTVTVSEAGDYLLCITAQCDPVNTFDVFGIGFTDGVTPIETHRLSVDNFTDWHQPGSLWTVKNVPANTTFTVTATGSLAGDAITHSAITAINLDTAFAEAYSTADLTNYPNPGTPSAWYPVDFEFIAQNSGEFMAVGYCRQKWGGAARSGHQEILINIDPGNLGSFGGNIQAAQTQLRASDLNTLFVGLTAAPVTTFTVAAGDRVRVRWNDLDSRGPSEEWEGLGVAVFALATADILTEQFVVGDPVYKTRIDGTAICVANNIGVNWADSNAVEAEFLVLEGENGPGALLTDQYNQPSFVGPHNRVTTSTSWVDVTDFFIDTSGLTNGANYFFFINTTNANGSSNFPTTSETRLATDSGATEFIDSVAIYCQADNPGVGYNYQMVHPVDTSSNITLQHRDINGNSVESYYWTAWGLNTDNLAPNSFFHSVDEIGITISSSGFKSTAASVTVPAGDYLFFTTARHNPTGGSTEFLYTGISDGTTNTQTHFFQNDATQDRIQSGGTWIEKNVAEGTTFTTTVACDQGRGSVSLAAITAIRLGGFKEYYSERNDTQVIYPQVTNPYPVDFEFVAQNSGVFAAVGFCKTKWPASGQSGLQQVLVNIDAGNLGSFGSDIQIARSISQSTDNPTTGEYTKAITPNNTFTVTAGDRVRVRCGRYLSANSADLEQYNGVAVAVFSLAASDILTEQFVAGDPGYTTVIEGTATNITSVATDIDGTLNVDGLATFQADVTISDDLTITSGAPKIFMQDTDLAIDEGAWIIANTTNQFRIETASDAAPETPVDQAITIERTGTTVDYVEMPRVIAGDPGTESSGITVNGVTYQSVIKASDIGGTNAAQFIMHRHSTTLPAAIVGARSKDDTSAHTIVADNDVLLGLYAAGWDGVDSYSLSSAIEFEIDGTPGQNDMPGQITFFTSADGTELLVERMRIRSTGDVEIDNDLTVAGDFTVSGTLTSINTSDLNVADNIIILNSGETGAPTLDAGIEIERGTSDNVLFRWNETSDVWEFTNDGTTYFPVVTEHTGEVTGSTALTLDVTAVTNRTDVVAEAADDVAIHDDTDGTLKKVNLSSITDGGFF